MSNDDDYQGSLATWEVGREGLESVLVSEVDESQHEKVKRTGTMEEVKGKQQRCNQQQNGAFGRRRCFSVQQARPEPDR